MSDLAQLFPSLQGPPYLNHAAIAPIPLSVAEAVRKVTTDQLTSGGRQYDQWLANEGHLRTNLVRMLGADIPEDIALLPNTASAISTLAEGLDWQPGDEIVVPAEEFPSNRLPWLAQARHGVKIREVPWQAIPTDDAEHDPEADLIAACNENTRVVAISAVAWHNGFRFDLQRLGEFCHRHGIIFCVDAIQQLGALGINVTSCHIDCLAAGSHKWLLCPEGLAVFYTTPELRQQLRPSRHGWRMSDEPFEFNKAKWHTSESGRKFEPGTGNNLGIAAMAAATDLLLETGLEQVEQGILRNQNRLAVGIDQLPETAVLSNQDQHRQSGILVFNHPRLALIEQALDSAGITYAMRGGGLRLSPHFYQPTELMDQALDVIQSALS